MLEREILDAIWQTLVMHVDAEKARQDAIELIATYNKALFGSSLNIYQQMNQFGAPACH